MSKDGTLKDSCCARNIENGCYIGNPANIKKDYTNRKETRDAYHLHRKPGNSSWKIKWYTSFYLEYF